MPARQPESPQEGGEGGGVIAILVLGVGYRKQCEEKAVQCLSRLNIGLEAGMGRLQKRRGGRLSLMVALAVAAFQSPAREGLLLLTLPELPHHIAGHPQPCTSLFGGVSCWPPPPLQTSSLQEEPSAPRVDQDVPTTGRCTWPRRRQEPRPTSHKDNPRS